MRWERAAAVWLGLAVLMIAQGWVRELFIAPALGGLRAHQLSSLTGALIIVVVSALTLGWLGAVGRLGRQLQLGVFWLALTVLFEFVFGHWVAGHTWERLLRDYDMSAGRLWLLVLLATLLGPWLAGRLRKGGQREPDSDPAGSADGR